MVVCHEIRISVGEIVVSIRCKDKEFVNFLRSQYHNFISHSAPAVFINVIDRDYGKDLFKVEDYSHIKQISFDKNTLRIEGSIFSSFFDMNVHRGEISQPLIFQPLDIFIYTVTFLYLMQEGSFFLHASAVIRGCDAYVFFGPSGSGKSTIASLADGMSFAEDIVLIKRGSSGHYYAAGTPFLEGKNISVSLKGMFRLRKAVRNDLSILSPSMAVRELMDNIPFSFIHSSVIKGLFDTVFSLASNVPCCNLHFVPDRSFWKVIEQNIK